MQPGPSGRDDGSKAHAPIIRPATAADARLILTLIRELAAFERESSKVETSEEAILREGFGERPAFGALIAEVDGVLAGMALFYWTYSTWTGRRGLYVDDLYVREVFRGAGLGEALLRAAAGLAVEHGCIRLDLHVLSWNPARGFYERLGFVPQEEWLPYRLSGDTLRAFASAEAP